MQQSINSSLRSLANALEHIQIIHERRRSDDTPRRELVVITAQHLLRHIHELLIPLATVELKDLLSLVGIKVVGGGREELDDCQVSSLRSIYEAVATDVVADSGISTGIKEDLDCNEVGIFHCEVKRSYVCDGVAFIHIGSLCNDLHHSLSIKCRLQSSVEIGLLHDALKRGPHRCFILCVKAVTSRINVYERVLCQH